MKLEGVVKIFWEKKKKKQILYSAIVRLLEAKIFNRLSIFTLRLHSPILLDSLSLERERKNSTSSARLAAKPVCVWNHARGWLVWSRLEIVQKSFEIGRWSKEARRFSSSYFPNRFPAEAAALQKWTPRG